MNLQTIALTVSRCPFACASWFLAGAALLVGQIALPACADPVTDGKAAFSQCSICHSITGTEDSGPHLNGVVGRKGGSVTKFNYSSAMKNTDIVWDTQTLDKFLADPQQAVPGTRMPFSGLPDSAKRAALIAYLATLEDDGNDRPGAPAAPAGYGDGHPGLSSTSNAPDGSARPADPAPAAKAAAAKTVKGSPGVSAKKTPIPGNQVQHRDEVRAW
jgi:cytochrome c